MIFEAGNFVQQAMAKIGDFSVREQVQMAFSAVEENRKVEIMEAWSKWEQVSLRLCHETCLGMEHKADSTDRKAMSANTSSDIAVSRFK